MATVDIDCVRTNSGFIYFHDGSIYDAAASQNPEIYRLWDSAGGAIVEETRGYYQFNTSDANTGIPAANTITNVELFYNYSSGPLTSTGTFAWDWYIYAGDIVGAALNGNATEWNAGSLVAFGIFPGSPPTSDFWIDLGDIGALFNRSGTTDFKIEDHTVPGTPEDAFVQVVLLNGITVNNRGKLRITHQAPATDFALPVFGSPHAGI